VAILHLLLQVPASRQWTREHLRNCEKKHQTLFMLVRMDTSDNFVILNDSESGRRLDIVRASHKFEGSALGHTQMQLGIAEHSWNLMIAIVSCWVHKELLYRTSLVRGFYRAIAKWWECYWALVIVMREACDSIHIDSKRTRKKLFSSALFIALLSEILRRTTD